MRILLVLNPKRLMLWHLWLANALEAITGPDSIMIEFERELGELPASLRALLAFERFIGRSYDYRASEPVTADCFPQGLVKDRSWEADLKLNLSGAHQNCDTHTLTPLFDGTADDSALWSALLDGRMPWLAIFDNHGNKPFDIGLPASERLHFISAGADSAYARTLQCIVRIVGDVRAGKSPRISSSDPPGPCSSRRPALREVSRFAFQRLRQSAESAIDRILKSGPHWAVAWRTVQDRSLLPVGPYRLDDLTILPDDGCRYYADPFALAVNGFVHVFVEEVPYATGRGLISHFVIDREGHASQPRPVLERPYHLSYPHTFKHGGHFWMVPESTSSGALELYRADPFPDRWVFETQLLEGRFHDPTLFEHEGRFWLFAAPDTLLSSRWDELSVFSAKDLRGPWEAHPMNPVIVDARAARPAGGIIRHGAELWRPAQDCSAGYGSGLSFARIARLNVENFVQEPAMSVRFASGTGVGGPHTFNQAGVVELIDLFASSNRLCARQPIRAFAGMGLVAACEAVFEC